LPQLPSTPPDSDYATVAKPEIYNDINNIYDSQVGDALFDSNA
jgi:hypothetical protein